MLKQTWPLLHGQPEFFRMSRYRAAATAAVFIQKIQLFSFKRHQPRNTSNFTWPPVWYSRIHPDWTWELPVLDYGTGLRAGFFRWSWPRLFKKISSQFGMLLANTMNHGTKKYRPRGVATTHRNRSKPSGYHFGALPRAGAVLCEPRLCKGRGRRRSCTLDAASDPGS